MWVVDNQSLAFLAVNDAAVALYGYSRDEFLALTMDQIADPDESAIEPERNHEAHGPAPTTPWRHRRKDGAILRVESTWHEIPFDGHEAVLVLTIDRTEQFRAEERNREQARLLDLAADAIIVRDLKHRVAFWNHGAERQFGYLEAEAVGQSITMLIPPDLRDEETRILEHLRRGEPVKPFETTRRRKDGTSLDVSLTVSPLVDARGTIVGASKIARDITERKRAEVALRENATLFSKLVEHAPTGVYVVNAQFEIIQIK